MEEIFQFNKKILTEHVTMTTNSDSKVFKDNIESLLEWRSDPSTGQRRLIPPNGNQLICYIDDLHLSEID